MYSFHSSLEEKNQLLYTLTQYGIETTVDRTRKKDRIREWIQSSAIAEENEEESDLEDLEKVNDNSDVDEESSMKGRHFPERRPSARTLETSSRGPTSSKSRGQIVNESQNKNGTNGKARRANTIINSNHRAARSMRHMERRNPFAPQVAHERHTVARSANFPNGDPSLGLVDNSATAAENARKMAELEKEQLLLSSVGSINDLPGTSGQQTVNQINSARSSNSPIKKTVMDESDANHRLLQRIQEFNRENSEGGGNEAAGYSENPPPRSPQAPNRKHRSQTAPFPAPIMQQANNYQAEALSRRSHSAVALPTARAEPFVTVSDQVANNYNNNDNNSNNNKNNNDNNNPLTMSVASHLVMQSFNALQALNTQPIATPGVIKSRHAHRPHNSQPTKKDKSVEREIPNVTYGKDAYEHYGIAQRAVGINRSEVPRQGSTGSGSRSVSN